MEVPRRQHYNSQQAPRPGTLPGVRPAPRSVLGGRGRCRVWREVCVAWSRLLTPLPAGTHCCSEARFALALPVAVAMRRLGSVQRKMPCVFVTEVKEEPSAKREHQVAGAAARERVPGEGARARCGAPGGLPIGRGPFAGFAGEVEGGGSTTSAPGRCTFSGAREEVDKRIFLDGRSRLAFAWKWKNPHLK